MPELDPRLLRVTIILDGVPQEPGYERLAMSVKGTKMTSDISNVCEIRIANIKKEVRDKLLTEGTPYSRTKPPKNSILIEAGRKSTGFHQVYVGDITTVNVTQPPDIWLVIRSITGKQNKNTSVVLAMAGKSQFRLIADLVAKELGATLEFTAADKTVSNFTFSGSADKLISSLSEISRGVDAYLDDDRLVVKPRFDPISGGDFVINIDTGLVGIPEFIDLGVRCTVLLRSEIRLGQRIQLTSAAYPAVDGAYVIYRLGFDLANRDSPFYYIVEASNPDLGKKAA